MYMCVFFFNELYNLAKIILGPGGKLDLGARRKDHGQDLGARRKDHGQDLGARKARSCMGQGRQDSKIMAMILAKRARNWPQ